MWHLRWKCFSLSNSSFELTERLFICRDFRNEHILFMVLKCVRRLGDIFLIYFFFCFWSFILHHFKCFVDFSNCTIFQAFLLWNTSQSFHSVVWNFLWCCGSLDQQTCARKCNRYTQAHRKASAYFVDGFERSTSNQN